MAQTYIYFIFILIAWGIWGFFAKYALKFISVTDLIIFNVIASIIIDIILLVVLLYLRGKAEINTTGAAFAMLTAFFGIMGGVLFLFTLSKAKASILVPLTALYPIVTIALSFILLKERVTIAQGIGIVLAIISGVLLSI